MSTFNQAVLLENLTEEPSGDNRKRHDDKDIHRRLFLPHHLEEHDHAGQTQRIPCEEKRERRSAPHAKCHQFLYDRYFGERCKVHECPECRSNEIGDETVLPYQICDNFLWYNDFDDTGNKNSHK